MSIRSIPSWVNEYIGIPFVKGGRSLKGADCWGLVIIIMEEQFNVLVPHKNEFSYGTKEEIEEAAAAIIHEADKPIWKEIPVEDALAGDIVLMRIANLPLHTGVVVAPKHMLHTEKNIDSMFERYDNLLWSNRVLGMYRHAALNS